MGSTLASMMSTINAALAPDTGGDGIESLKRSLWAASGVAEPQRRRTNDVANPLIALERMRSQL